MLPKVNAEFRITGHNLLPAQITQAIGLLPTRTWLKEESIQGTKLRRKHHGWCLSLGNGDDFTDLEDSMRDLLKILLTKTEQISRLRNEYNVDCEMSCVVRMRDETPSLSLEKETVEALSWLGTAIDIDIILIA